MFSPSYILLCVRAKAFSEFGSCSMHCVANEWKVGSLRDVNALLLWILNGAPTLQRLTREQSLVDNDDVSSKAIVLQLPNWHRCCSSTTLHLSPRDNTSMAALRADTHSSLINSSFSLTYIIRRRYSNHHVNTSIKLTNSTTSKERRRH